MALELRVYHCLLVGRLNKRFKVWSAGFASMPLSLYFDGAQYKYFDLRSAQVSDTHRKSTICYCRVSSHKQRDDPSTGSGNTTDSGNNYRLVSLSNQSLSSLSVAWACRRQFMRSSLRQAQGT